MNKLLSLILISIVLFFGYGIYQNLDQAKIKKELRVSCQKKTTTFENISNKELIPKAIELLKSNNYKVISRIEFSKYMETKILNHISIEQADNFLENSIKKIAKTQKTQDEINPSNEKLIIDYYIYENDKEDKGKKSEKAKLYAGYLVFEFKLENKLIYKIQADYMKMDTSDIPERMDCIIKSFITLKGE
ncbi:MAG: hypothetical protein WBF48_07855 [Halarcobacter sp.]